MLIAIFRTRKLDTCKPCQVTGCYWTRNAIWFHIFYMIIYQIYLRDAYCNECVHSNRDGHSEVFHHWYGPLFVQKDLQARGSMGTIHILILFNVDHQLQTIQDSCTRQCFIQLIVSQSVHYKTYCAHTFNVIRNILFLSGSTLLIYFRYKHAYSSNGLMLSIGQHLFYGSIGITIM